MPLEVGLSSTGAQSEPRLRECFLLSGFIPHRGPVRPGPVAFPGAWSLFIQTHELLIQALDPERPGMDCPVLPQPEAMGYSKQKDG